MDLWGREDGGRDRVDRGATKGPGAQAELHPRVQEPDDCDQCQCRHSHDISRIPMGVLCVKLNQRDASSVNDYLPIAFIYRCRTFHIQWYTYILLVLSSKERSPTYVYYVEINNALIKN